MSTYTGNPKKVKKKFTFIFTANYDTLRDASNVRSLFSDLVREYDLGHRRDNCKYIIEDLKEAK